MLNLNDCITPRDPMSKYNNKLCYFPSWYDDFGNIPKKEELKKLLPCVGKIEKQSGDNFYYFTLFTKDGPKHACGYYGWIPIEKLEEKFK